MSYFETTDRGLPDFSTSNLMKKFLSRCIPVVPHFYCKRLVIFPANERLTFQSISGLCRGAHHQSILIGATALLQVGKIYKVKIKMTANGV